MTCAEARHLILIADPAALRDRSDATLRTHLERCAECAAAASHVVDDLSRLRAALIARGSSRVAVSRPRRSRRRVVMTLVPVALAAELALFAFLSNRDVVHPMFERQVIDDSVTTLLPVAHTGTDTGEVARAVATKPERPAVAKAAQADDSTADADTVAAVPVSRTPSLQVKPLSPREQVAVIATSNPKVTVVWITRGDSL